MQIKDIPQDNSSTYHGHSKIIYATQNGKYQASTSTGWETEEYATEQAVSELAYQAEQAKQMVLAGKYSPLYYYMLACRYDETELATAMGIWRWQLRRHMKVSIFQRLPEKTLTRYANLFQISINQLKNIK